MVNNFKKTLVLFLLCLPAGFAAAQTNTKEPAKKNVVVLTQKNVAELVLKQSFRAKEINLTAQQVRFQLAEIERRHDFQFSIASGYQNSKYENLNNRFLNLNQQYSTNASLKKELATTGTTLGLEFSRLSDKSDFSSAATTTTAPYTQDIFGVTLSQSLLANFFGVASRAEVRAGEKTVEAAEINRVLNLQQLVLEAVRAYWDTYVAQESFQEALNSRNRYLKLVESIRKKSGFGYTSPGELSQAQAELEGREQRVRSTSASYLQALDSFITLLKLPPDTEIQFQVDNDIPPPPSLNKVEIEKLRSLVAAEKTAEAAEDNYKAARSRSMPDLALVANYYSQGLDESASAANSEALGGTRPQYYVGMKLTYGFGSGYQKELKLNRKVSKELAESQLERKKLELKDEELFHIRNIQAAYAIAVSAKAQRAFREKAAQEVTRSYNQGRTDISLFIEVLNKYFDSEVAMRRAIGDYQIILNQWAAFRDELIPSPEITK